MKTISKNNLIEIIKKSTAEEIILYITGTVKMIKTGNPLAKSVVEKATYGTFSFGKSYKDRINEAIESSNSDQKYEGGKLPWGHWVKGAEGKVIEYDKVDKKSGEMISNLYLRYYPGKEYPKVTYIVDDVQASEDDIKTIEKFIPKKNNNKMQESLGISDAQKVMPLIVNFDNITFIGIDSTVYKIDG